MYYLGPIVTWFVRQRASAVRQMMDFPHQAQQTVFDDLIRKAADTEWGKRYDYASIRTYRDFQNRVPVQDYDTVKPYIDRAMQGEQNVLWPTPIRWFSKSSGTTSDVSKFIPMSKESIEDCHYKVAQDLLTMYCETFQDTSIFSGKGLVLGGSHQVNQLNQNSSYGDLSAVLLQNMSFLAQLYRAPDLNIALMDDWEQKIEKLAQSTINENITNVSGVPTWTMVLAKRLFELTGKQTLKDVWPNLELYIHGGVSFTPYREQFRQIAGSGVHFLETYNASEGFFAFQCDWNSPGMLLHLNAGMFFEFIPQSDWHSDNPRALTIDEVNTTDNYALVISTNGGLWRYKIGDTVRFTSTKPFKIEVSRRIKHYINAFGEEVIAENADRAIDLACKDTGAKVIDYTVAPVYLKLGEQGRHEWLVEFEQHPDSVESFTRSLDSHLRAVNSDYDAKRSYGLALREPLVRAMPPQTFYNWLKSKGKLGGQHKVPRLSNDRTFVEELLALTSTAV
jgi:hypothetical protein